LRVPSLRIDGENGETMLLEISVTDEDIENGISPFDERIPRFLRARYSPLALAVARALGLKGKYYSVNTSSRHFLVGSKSYGTRLIMKRRDRRELRRLEQSMGKPFSFRTVVMIRQIAL
jgi:hypothetical protein